MNPAPWGGGKVETETEAELRGLRRAAAKCRTTARLWLAMVSGEKDASAAARLATKAEAAADLAHAIEQAGIGAQDDEREPLNEARTAERPGGRKDMLRLEVMGSLAHPWPHVYFHGSAQEWVDGKANAGAVSEGDRLIPELVSSDADLGSLADDVYDADVYGRASRLWLWTSRFGWRRGLVAITDDVQACADAERKFRDKEAFI